MAAWRPAQQAGRTRGIPAGTEGPAVASPVQVTDGTFLRLRAGRREVSPGDRGKRCRRGSGHAVSRLKSSRAAAVALGHLSAIQVGAALGSCPVEV